MVLKRCGIGDAAGATHDRDNLAGSLSGSLTSDMTISDFDIQRLAHLFIQLDGEQAIAKAREMVEKMRRKGDEESADKWLRVIVAIGELGEPPTEARH